MLTKQLLKKQLLLLAILSLKSHQQRIDQQTGARQRLVKLPEKHTGKA